ncbi:hypothetical protein TCAL_13211 [Tigriopus californicus]|uniref:fructose-bisphosphate aldolase n=1 Tax=Tigriopus californicus TaxID=6832 RepID=A0A553PIB9_TIGCA|nr:fructose-bisphosphate aldolase-like isoform X1 [Tigriopus californicus]TRY77423.1 hypothetical protein TCAL_13211 [Tigriopus californicus]|eukprot:TCALIF_13211-PA protein Name:"Similar to Ald Fructose-bisphosphate aldolase (Drosophila melanogaster)" AED:0.02 eAED:0.02 QI:235/1/1/1/1/1/4/326/354
MTRSSHLNAESQAELTRIVRRICQKGKGILAADETPMAMEDRFQNLNITNSDENRRLYRQLLFTTPKSEISSLSAVILQHETVYQKLDDGRDFIQAVNDIGIVPGITLDKGWRAIPGHPGEVFTQGLDDLDARCKTYKSLGLHFAKWRMAITIQGETVPSKTMIDEGVRSLALYALICQTNGIVPIVEPDISRIGDHSWQRQQEVFELVNNKLYEVLKDYGVFIEGTILKCSMVTAGKTNAQGATPQQVGRATRASLNRSVPVSVAGIFFLSGGLSELESTANLNAINAPALLNDELGMPPWQLSFCFGRALQDSCRRAWAGQEARVSQGQAQFIKRVALNGKAALGQYQPEDE